MRSQPKLGHNPGAVSRTEPLDAAPALSNRVVEYLLKAEMKEPEICYRDEYRQARIVVALASKGDPDPFTAASYQIYGLHPDAIWPRIVADRKAQLGAKYGLWYCDDDTLKPDVVIPDYDPFSDPRRKPSPSAERFCNERLSA